MDLPIKFELPKLSHSDLITSLLPLLPGTLAAFDLMLLGFTPKAAFVHFGIGYKASLVVVLLLAYLVGTVMMRVTEFAYYLIFNRIKPVVATSVSDDYWRQLAREYLGERLTPRVDETKTTVDLLSRWSGFLDEDTKKDLDRLKSELDKFHRKLEEVSKMLSLVTDAHERATLERQIGEVGERINAAENAALTRSRASAETYHWLQIRQALRRLFSVEDPYTGYGMLQVCIATSSLWQLLVCLFSTPFRLWWLIGFCIAGICSCTKPLWQMHQLGVADGTLNTAGIAALLREIKSSRDPSPKD